MAVPNIILPKPLVLVSPGGSGLDGTALGGNITFGTVAAVYGTCEMYGVGDTVMYITTGQQEIGYGTDPYFIIDEKNILNKEVIVP